MIYQAHKGVSTENPENTFPALEAAVEQGYGIIELDVAVTRDGQFVLLHDKTLNRTARKKDGSELSEPLAIGELSYEEAAAYDYGLHFGKKFRGTALPLFREVLLWAQEKKIPLKIDNKYQRYSDGEKEAFFRLLAPFQDVACLTCSSVEELERAAKKFDTMHFHYDGDVTDEVLERLAALLPKERLTVWLPMKTALTGWVKLPFADKACADRIRTVARLGIWILTNRKELAEAAALGAEVVETNGQLKPPQKKQRVDMHTHSEHSHDSVAPIAAMLEAQRARGTNCFAVTDHFDTASHLRYDVFTPMVKAAETVDRLNGEQREVKLLRGIEISESFWYPEVYEKARSLADFDVIIGSVHLVKYPGWSTAYSTMDFSRADEKLVADYVDAYFSDVLTMLSFGDFDILAHLTCPLRYLTGKFGFAVDLAPYREKIDAILTYIIRHGIALEVNTSSYEALGDAMPSKELLTRYRDLGGYLITLASDAHKPEQVARHFDKATKTLLSLGFEHIYYYEKRKAHPVGIERY